MSYRRSFLFSSESVSEGHPDKAADQVSDAILDWALKLDPHARVACETLLAKNLVVIAGEFGSVLVPDLAERLQAEAPHIARATLREIGYTAESGLDVEGCEVKLSISKQTDDIDAGVTKSDGVIGAGDQGLMFGYACDETPELMPLPIALAHALVRRQSELRRSGQLPWLRPDAKSQVTVRYVDGRPLAVERVVLSTQHAPGIGLEELRAAVRERIILPVIPAALRASRLDCLINPTGNFVTGGPEGDTGLTGRKIIVDSYGGSAPHGGGAFSGKDPTKVDRSAAYAARYVAKNIVAAGFARRCTVQLAYAIGVTEPVSIYVHTHGTGAVSDESLEAAVRAGGVCDLTPRGIIEALELRRPIYRSTAAYGHFGRELPAFTWERTDRADALRKALGELHEST